MCCYFLNLYLHSAPFVLGLGGGGGGYVLPSRLIVMYAVAQIHPTLRLHSGSVPPSASEYVLGDISGQPNPPELMPKICHLSKDSWCLGVKNDV